MMDLVYEIMQTTGVNEEQAQEWIDSGMTLDEAIHAADDDKKHKQLTKSLIPILLDYCNGDMERTEEEAFDLSDYFIYQVLETKGV